MEVTKPFHFCSLTTIHEVAIIPRDEEAEAGGWRGVGGLSPHAHCLYLMAQGLPGDSRAGGWPWSTQGVDGCPWVLVTELVMQNVIPATVSTMPANAPGIMGKN